MLVNQLVLKVLNILFHNLIDGDVENLHIAYTAASDDKDSDIYLFKIILELLLQYLLLQSLLLLLYKLIRLSFLSLIHI